MQSVVGSGRVLLRHAVRRGYTAKQVSAALSTSVQGLEKRLSNAQPRGYFAAPLWDVPAGRTFASTPDEEEDSHDDFKPKRKANLSDPEKVQNTIDELVKTYPVFVFMKGTPEQPMCGFSAQVVKALHDEGVNFHSVNVLDHQEIREGVKQYSDWPTIPQLYINGEFVGGCDIIVNLHSSGELKEMLPESSLSSD